MTRKKSPAEELRELIEDLGMTQQQAADELGMSRRMLSYYLTGSHDVERRTLLAMRWLAEHPEGR